MKWQLLGLIVLFAAYVPYRSTASELRFDNDQQTVVFVVSSANSFDRSLPRLRYSDNDATRFIDTMLGVGRIKQENIIHLRNPRIAQMRSRLQEASERFTPCRTCQTKFIFYFTGHSERKGLHLRDGLFEKEELHNLFKGLDSQSTIAILDSCFAGALSRKSGQSLKTEIFYPTPHFEEPSGIVFLAASSERDMAFESRRLEGSVFTHHLILGLSGKADINGDGIVSVDELYGFIYREMKPGSNPLLDAPPQRPEFIANLEGRGALAISYPASSLGFLTLHEDIAGVITAIRKQGLQHFEFNKELGQLKTLSLPAGGYRLSVSAGPNIGYADINVDFDEKVSLRADNLIWTSRGGRPLHMGKGSGPLEAKAQWYAGLLDNQFRALAHNFQFGVEIPSQYIDLWGTPVLSVFDVMATRQSYNQKRSLLVGMRWGLRKDFRYSLFFEPHTLALVAGGGFGLFDLRNDEYTYWPNGNGQANHRKSGLSGAFFARVNPYWHYHDYLVGFFLSLEHNPTYFSNQLGRSSQIQIGLTASF